MGDYNRNDRGGGRGGRRYGGGGGRDFARREMHHATCAQCGRDCEVPFRPRDDRSVYCSDCFEKRRSEDGGGRGSSGRNFNRPSYSENRDRGNTRDADTGQLMDQLKSLNNKLDKIISILEPKVTTTLAQKTVVTDIVVKPKTAKPKASKKKSKEEKVELG